MLFFGRPIIQQTRAFNVGGALVLRTNEPAGWLTPNAIL